MKIIKKWATKNNLTSEAVQGFIDEIIATWYQGYDEYYPMYDDDYYSEEEGATGEKVLGAYYYELISYEYEVREKDNDLYLTINYFFKDKSGFYYEAEEKDYPIEKDSKRYWIGLDDDCDLIYEDET